ncbi:putative dihydropyridine-sensitive l-type calcium channel [Schistosoma mansoni]|uniref:putative dihydropyridine-sensitive l-type calcium channel n=1 Tax=Schistosoma mansoni TaxID=6183 RepID=UPI0001A63B8B|nr:putative dihydropyridine-sensitive l-type calcium channel [Schistosoma mansoni]|eukprot:XP_018649686.1 putative dihydropyridine-sensitive l-type calcium channel [Schistosoma mansoni]
MISGSFDNDKQTYIDIKQNFDRWVTELSKSFSELHTITGEPYLKSNIKVAAEEAFVKRAENEPIGCYYRAKALTIVPPLNETDNCSIKFYIPLKQSPHHDNQYVCYNFSVVHVPTNVYDLSDKLKRIGNWTTELDKVFKLNAESDPTLKWQYFGSSTGFFRYYPGAMWDIQLDEYRLDFFDCRSQPWYLQASAYPKEMIILIDKSGSMKGRSDIISNATAAEILNTLTENDYFNVMMFSDSTMYADPLITDRLIQGTKFNKDKMIKTFRKFSPNGTASYENAITEVFKLFNKTDENFPSNHKCNRMIMIITDSAPGSYEHLFKEFNPQASYAVNIATLADVKENVLKYLDVIARSNALQDDAYFTWTGVTVRQFNLKNIPSRSFMNGFMQNMLMEPEPVRIDTMIASKEELPKMYTSVAKAVFDKTNKAKRLKEGNLLGVAGVDIPLQSFQDTLRGWKIGANNYLFAVDNNGFVLFHPDYRPVYKALLKSYYQNVDINEVEVMRDVKIDPHTMFEASKKYFIAPIDQTPFTLGLAIQWDSNTQKGYPIPEYRFNSKELFNNLHGDEEYLGRIYLDAKETRDLPAYWYKQSKSSSITKNFITDHIGGVEDSLYSATILTSRYLSEDNVLVFHTPPNDLFRHFSSEKLNVPVTLTTTVFHEPSKTPMGIVGLQITHTQIQNEFNRITNTCFTGKCHVCGEPGFDCYIINQAAMILASNVGEKEVGQSLKEINCALVEDLVKHSILNEIYLYDFQGICIETSQETPNFGNHLYPPFRIVWKIIIWFVNEITLFMFGFVEDLLSYRITFGQKWGLYSETEDLIDNDHKETFTSYTNKENNLPSEDFMIRQNLIYYNNLDQKNTKKINNRYQDLSNQYPYDNTLINNVIHERPSYIHITEKQFIEDDPKIIDKESYENKSIIESPLIPELKEESIDELYGKIDYDPYDTQLKALTAIETCRKEQTIQIQSILDLQLDNGNMINNNNSTTDEVINYPELTNTTSINIGSSIFNKGNKLIPGSLLACVHRSVQQRCHSGAGTSSFTGRYACEAICEIVRERMPHLANRLEDCKQPLTSCTERFITYNVILNKSKQFPNDHHSPLKATENNLSMNDNDFTGEYCNECGGR